jgi:hypothetical protein
MSSDWYTNPVWRFCVALENPAAIFLCAPRSYDDGSGWTGGHGGEEFRTYMDIA